MTCATAQLHPKELAVSSLQMGSRFPGWMEDFDTSASLWPPLGPPVPRGWAADSALLPVLGWQQVHRVPRLFQLHLLPRQQPLVRARAGKTQNKAKSRSWMETAHPPQPPQDPALAMPWEGGSGFAGTHAPSALGSTAGLLHTDSSAQSQREHPASSTGSAPRQGGKTWLSPIPTKPQLLTTLGP